jgi:hypothetical protein
MTPSEHKKVIRKYYPEERGPVTYIDPIGNSPVLKISLLQPMKVLFILIITANESTDNDTRQNEITHYY